MKPRTKNQREVNNLIHLVGLPSLKLTKWAENKAFEHKAYSTSKTRWCSECGRVHIVADVPEHKHYVFCPYCGAKLKVFKSERRTDWDREYYGALTTVNGWQVYRLFLCLKEMRKNEASTFEHYEVGQRWMKPGASKVTYETPLRGIGCWYGRHPFDLSREMTLKDEPRVRIAVLPIYPKMQILDEYKTYGVTKNFHDISAIDVFESLPKSSKAETLWKAGEYDLFRKFYCNNVYDIEKYWPSIKICLRNKYRIKDIDSWMDYINALKFLGLDERNAHYVCPDNLAEAHDRMIDRKARKEELIEMAALSEKNVKYQSRIKKFENMNISDGQISLIVLPSIKEFKKEGDYLNHCVYKCKYYDKPESLILSARMDGHRIETIEVDLRNYEVLQCHGNHNLPSEFHDEIMGLVESNMKVIRKFNKGNARARI